MFAIDDEKLPPPRPAVAAQATRIHSCVPWAWAASQPLGTRNASSEVGISSSDALTAVHARPPKRGMANVYGMRKNEPTTLGTKVRRNNSETDSEMPALPRFNTTIVQRTQTQKPMCSANM